MAGQADGTIYINTAIDTDGFKAGSKEVENAARRMAASVSGIGRTAELAMQKAADAFAKQNAAYAQQEAKVESLRSKLEDMQNQKVATDAYKALVADIDKANAEFDRLMKKREDFISEHGEKEIIDLDALAKANLSFEEMVSKIENAYTKSEAQVFQGMENEIDRLDEKITQLIAQKKELESSGKAYTTPDTSGVESQLVAEREKLLQSGNALGTSYEMLKNKMEQYIASAEKTASAEAKASKTTEEVGNKLQKVSKDAAKASVAMGGLCIGAKSMQSAFKKGIGTILKYAFGIRSLYVLVRKLRQAIKEGFNNLAQFSSETNQSLSAVKSALTQLKNSLATAFNPILTAVTPALVKLINLCSEAATRVGMLIAALTGAKTFTKAIAVQEDYAASLDKSGKAAKKLQGYLSGLDEVRRFENNDDDGGGGGVSPSDMFETVPIDSAITDFLDKMRSVADYLKGEFAEAWDVVKSGFDNALGDPSGRIETIKNSLKSIKDNVIEIVTDPEVQSSYQKWKTSFLYTIGSVAGATASIGLTIGANLVGGFSQYLDENKDKIKSTISTVFELKADTLDTYSEFLATISDIFSVFAEPNGIQITADAFTILSDVLGTIIELSERFSNDFVHLVCDPIIDNKDSIKEAVDNSLGVLATVLDALKEHISNLRDTLIQFYDEHLHPFFESIKEGVSELVDTITEVYNEYIAPALQEAGDALQPFLEQYVEPLINAVLDFVGEVIDIIKLLWEKVLQPLINWIIKNVVPVIVPIVQILFDTIVPTIKNLIAIITAIIQTLGALLSFIKDIFTVGFSQAWKNLKTKISSIVSSLGEKLINSFLTMVSKIKTHFERLKTALVNIWNSIRDAIRTPINAIIGFINSMVSGIVSGINSMGSALNRLHIDVPDWVPGIGGRSFSLNIPTVSAPQIPYLASGAVIPPNAPFAAVLGDQRHGNNLEAPESLLRKIVREESGRQQGGVYNFTANINRRVLFDEIIEEGKLRQTISAKNPFELA